MRQLNFYMMTSLNDVIVLSHLGKRSGPVLLFAVKWRSKFSINVFQNVYLRRQLVTIIA